MHKNNNTGVCTYCNDTTELVDDGLCLCADCHKFLQAELSPLNQLEQPPSGGCDVCGIYSAEDMNSWDQLRMLTRVKGFWLCPACAVRLVECQQEVRHESNSKNVRERNSHIKELIEAYTVYTLEKSEQQGLYGGGKTNMATDDAMSIDAVNSVNRQAEIELIKHEITTGSYITVSRLLDEFLASVNAQVDKRSIQYMQLCRDIALAHLKLVTRKT